MNNLQLIFTQIIMFFSLATACGVFLHDTHIDRAVQSVWHKPTLHDISSDSPRARTGSSLHPHAEQLSVVKNRGDSAKALPRNRNKKQSNEQKIPARGYHGDNFCMPLAGEWT